MIEIPASLLGLLRARARRIMAQRRPDFVIGGAERPYLLRWWVIPRNPVFNVYLHQFLRDDDDRALHDHPWPSCSILLHGGYIEHASADPRRDPGGLKSRVEHRRRAGDLVLRGPRFAHRVELYRDPETLATVPAVTLFLTGPRLRTWGFHCPKGWIPWQQFVAGDDPGAIGKGCP